MLFYFCFILFPFLFIMSSLRIVVPSELAIELNCFIDVNFSPLILTILSSGFICLKSCKNILRQLIDFHAHLYKVASYHHHHKL